MSRGLSMIPKEKIEEVRDRASIVQVISDYVPLIKRGQNHTGLCPFHSEKSPSFTVSEEKKIYYCFGCNATGNVITFIMKKEGLTFPEAVRSLAKRYGVVIPEVAKTGPDPRELLYQALKASAEFFYKELRDTEGASARVYLKNRGFDGEIAGRFNLGFAPNRWDGLTGFLKKKGISTEAAIDAGVVIKGDKGNYDRFRNRVIFPITDVKGRIIGFGGRAIDNSMPKYLNSPESAVFKKGETLYGFFQAKQSIIKEGSAIVVEGYFDLLALHKNGFTNSIATMGTALTPQHLRALKPYGSVYALFDSDQAGRNAAIRGLQLFLSEEMACRAVLLPQGKDPDEFLALSGPDGMKKAIEAAEPLMEFFLKELEKKVRLTAPEGKKKYFDTAVEYLLKVKNVAERGHYASIVAATLGMAPSAIYDAIKMPLNGGLGLSKAFKGVLEAKDSNLKELTVLRVLLKHPELFSDKIETVIEVFRDPALKEIGLFIADSCKKGLKIDASTLGELKDEEAGTVAALLLREDDGFVESPEKMLEDSLKRILNRGRIKETTQEIINKLEETGRNEVASLIKKRFEAGPSGKGKA